ncbi:MAG: zinc ribbon domain-containing protein [Byssovorax sp.]
MPTYEYVCSACKNEWEFEQSMKDNALTECPRCHEQTARRQISRGTGFILKGGGWYSDLYSSTSNKAASTGDSASAGGSTTSTTPATTTTGDSGSSAPAAAPAASTPAKSETPSST